MSKTTFKEVCNAMNSAPSGGFVGITDYETQQGDVKSVTGQMGCSYADAKARAILELTDHITDGLFEPITVKGHCRAIKDGNGNIVEYNSRKKSWDMVEYTETFTVPEVLVFANEILDSWKNPKERKNNKVQLTEKENGLSYNAETGSFNFTLMVHHETYKVDASKEAKKVAGIIPKVKATMPESEVKKVIRGMFEKKIRDFTISEGKFKSLTINGEKFLSENITL